MDTVFNCPQCKIQISADESAVGVEIECPSCGEVQLVPPPKPPEPVAEATAEPAPSTPDPSPEAPAAAAAPEPPKEPAKEHKPLTLPVRAPGSAPPLIISKKGVSENAPKARVKVFIHSSCMIDGNDQFEEMVGEFLQKRGAENISAMHPISCGHVTEAGQVVPDFGIMIFYKG